MAVPKNSKLEVLAYLKDAAQRIRRKAEEYPEEASVLMRVVERLDKDAAELEAELVIAGYVIPEPGEC